MISTTQFFIWFFEGLGRHRGMDNFLFDFGSGSPVCFHRQPDAQDARPGLALGCAPAGAAGGARGGVPLPPAGNTGYFIAVPGIDILSGHFRRDCTLLHCPRILAAFSRIRRLP